MKVHSIAALVLATALLSCQSPKSKALKSVDRISQHVVAAQGYVGDVRPYVAEEGLPPLKKLSGELKDIGSEVVGVARPNIQKLENPESWWERMAQYLKWTLFGLAGLAALFFLGEAKLIPGVGPLIAWLASKGFSMARSATAEAALLFKLRQEVEEGAPVRLQSRTDAVIAAKRMGSPSFEGSYRRAKSQSKGPSWME